MSQKAWNWLLFHIRPWRMLSKSNCRFCHFRDCHQILLLTLSGDDFWDEFTSLLKFYSFNETSEIWRQSLNLILPKVRKIYIHIFISVNLSIYLLCYAIDIKQTWHFHLLVASCVCLLDRSLLVMITSVSDFGFSFSCTSNTFFPFSRYSSLVLGSSALKDALSLGDFTKNVLT